MLAPGWRGLIIFGGAVLFSILTGDTIIALALAVLLFYMEFRGKHH